MPIEFDFEAALRGLRAGQDLNGPKGILTPLIKKIASHPPFETSKIKPS